MFCDDQSKMNKIMKEAFLGFNHRVARCSWYRRFFDDIFCSNNKNDILFSPGNHFKIVNPILNAYKVLSQSYTPTKIILNAISIELS